MAILPINSISVMKNQRNLISFSGNGREDEEKRIDKFSQKAKMSAASVPVVVLMAMSPSLLNAKEPMKVVPMNSGLNTELLAKAADTALKTTYISSPEMYNQNSEDYGNWASLENQDIQMHHLAIGNGTKYHLLFTKSPAAGVNDVNSIYIIKDGSKGCNNISVTPPVVNGLIYHNIGKDKEFCSVKVVEPILKGDTEVGAMIREIRLDDDSANLIINLIAGDSKWKDNTLIGFHETTNPNLMSPQINDY